MWLISRIWIGNLNNTEPNSAHTLVFVHYLYFLWCFSQYYILNGAYLGYYYLFPFCFTYLLISTSASLFSHLPLFPQPCFISRSCKVWYTVCKSAMLMTEGNVSIALLTVKCWLPGCIRESKKEKWGGKKGGEINKDKRKTREREISM